MAFYDLVKEERDLLVKQIQEVILNDIVIAKYGNILPYFINEDTYIRKTAYLAIGKIYKINQTYLPTIIHLLNSLLSHNDFKVRQTVINAAGEIGKWDFETVQPFFDKGLFDEHHAVRNAVIGSVKKMGEVNPDPVLTWAQTYLHHPDKEIRREICHGIELRGRKYPQDILPLLKQLEHDPTKRVSNTLVHVIGQIAYKKGCLATVIADLKTWQNKDLVDKAILEIIDVHDRYKDFSILTQQEAINYISKHFYGDTL